MLAGDGSKRAMLGLNLGAGGGDRPLRLLCLGAHCDDIEIGCGGTVLKLAAAGRRLEVRWIVFSSDERRKREALKSAEAFLSSVDAKKVVVHALRDGFFPYLGAELKERFEQLKTQFPPDLIFTHYRQDLHQDHRLVSELTWNTFRNHLILEYEIPKYDGDFGSPNFFVPLDEAVCHRKIDTILGSFPSQSEKQWFTRELFSSVLRLRGMEANASSGYAEGFYSRKAILEMEIR
jgi:LmbE family N-acetylglucosaminyl deacetylase